MLFSCFGAIKGINLHLYTKLTDVYLAFLAHICCWTWGHTYLLLSCRIYTKLQQQPHVFASTHVHGTVNYSLFSIHFFALSYLTFAFSCAAFVYSKLVRTYVCMYVENFPKFFFWRFCLLNKLLGKFLGSLFWIGYDIWPNITIKYSLSDSSFAVACELYLQRHMYAQWR